MTDVTPEPPATSPSDQPAGRPSPTSGRSPMKAPLLIGAVVVVVAAVIVAVVVSGGGSPAKPKPITASPAAFTTAMKTTLKSSTISVSLSLSVSSGSTNFKLTGTGGWNVAQHSGQFMESISGSQKLSEFGPLTELIVGKTLYLKLGPELAAVLPTPWLSTTIKDASAVKVPTSDTKDLTQLPKLLTALQGILHVQNVGSGTIDGAAVTNYQSSFNTATAIASLKAMFPSEFSGLTDPTSAATLTVKVAIDGQQRLRQLQLNAVTTKGKAATVALTITFTSFDAPLSFQAPAANQVTPLSQLLGRTGGLGSL
jgi:hypothetical protein